MTNDLISRSALLRDPYFQEDRYPESHLLRMAIKEKHAVDAVEVVRCSECIAHSYDEKFDRHWCNNPMGGMSCALVKPDDFCSRGRRRV